MNQKKIIKFFLVIAFWVAIAKSASLPRNQWEKPEDLKKSYMSYLLNSNGAIK
ncbi:hypothetical protein N0824_02962 [Microcystis sp. 0824]|uniref:hypothetical protein n=1 Tax=Microcystis sp. 0824 TaxID=1502726 RepID=UPI000D0C1B81|nr:hypothetical protein [Microcystis sp. 0824]GBF55086.1 hypothetical protein N0824_02962 [Microcystis sp. 0824]